MESNENENFSQSRLCKNGCGFYGSSNFDYMCSKCYKDVVKRKNAAPNSVGGRMSPLSSGIVEASAERLDSVTSSLAQANLGVISSCQGRSDEMTDTQSDVETATTTVPVVSHHEERGMEGCEDGAIGGGVSGVEGGSHDEEGDKDRKSRKNRCHSCRKRVGLTGFQCRCGGVYCGLHRYSDKHQCSFNYKEHGQDLIRRSNPIVVSPKVHKI